MYKVKIEQFEGPLDLLLEIVEARKLNLIEIRLAEIAEQFVEYLKTLKARRGEEITEFLTIASRLVLLKSRELVPTLEDPPEGERELEELTKRLLLYQPFRRAARALRTLEREGRELYSREAFAGFESIFFFPKGLRAKTLEHTLSETLSSLMLPHRIPQAHMRTTITLSECVERVLARLRKQREVAFHELLETPGPEAQVLHFLSVLELSRRGSAHARQAANFDTITITYHG